jgi:hypothetical protein
MTNWHLLYRRTHLYLGLLLIPWLLVYALSTAVFNHRGYFRHGHSAAPPWLPLWEKQYTLNVAAGDAGLQEAARRILADHGLQGAFGIQRQGQRLTLNVQDFWHPLRLTCDLDRQQLRAEQRKFAWSELLARLHHRAGYGQPGLLNNLWPLIVDLFCGSVLLWIGTGLYLWWKLSATRRWGFITIGGGLASFLLLLVLL